MYSKVTQDESSDSAAFAQQSDALTRVSWFRRRNIAIGVLLLVVIIVISITLAMYLMSGNLKSEDPSHAGESIAVGATVAVLFVGDSFSFVNDINEQMRLLAASRTTPLILASDRATEGGATLQRLWSLSFVQRAIKKGRVTDPRMKYNYVVLQDDIPEYTDETPNNFFRYGKLFSQEIKAYGAQPVLFMAWAYNRIPWATLDQIALAHRQLSQELNIKVAPVGLAFRRSLSQRPDIAMLGGDAEHETLAGAYLGATVIFMTMFGGNATDLTYLPTNTTETITVEDGLYLRNIAYQSVKAWERGENT
jgi:hypothetical protein